MVQTLSVKQKRFVKELTRGEPKGKAAILAGYSPKSASVAASRLVKNESIIKALNQVGLSDKNIANKIKANIDSGTGIKATADTAIRGLELTARLKGYLDKEPEANTTLNQTNIYVQELKALDSEALQARLDSLVAEIASLKQ